MDALFYAVLELQDSPLAKYMQVRDLCSLCQCNKRVKNFIVTNKRFVRDTYWAFYGHCLTAYRLQFHKYLQLRDKQDYLYFFHPFIKSSPILQQYTQVRSQRELGHHDPVWWQALLEYFPTSQTRSLHSDDIGCETANVHDEIIDYYGEDFVYQIVDLYLQPHSLTTAPSLQSWTVSKYGYIYSILQNYGDLLYLEVFEGHFRQRTADLNEVGPKLEKYFNCRLSDRFQQRLVDQLLKNSLHRRENQDGILYRSWFYIDAGSKFLKALGYKSFEPKDLALDFVQSQLYYSDISIAYKGLLNYVTPIGGVHFDISGGDDYSDYEEDEEDAEDYEEKEVLYSGLERSLANIIPIDSFHKLQSSIEAFAQGQMTVERAAILVALLGHYEKLDMVDNLYFGLIVKAFDDSNWGVLSILLNQMVLYKVNNDSMCLSVSVLLNERTDYQERVAEYVISEIVQQDKVDAMKVILELFGPFSVQYMTQWFTVIFYQMNTSMNIALHELFDPSLRNGDIAIDRCQVGEQKIKRLIREFVPILGGNEMLDLVIPKILEVPQNSLEPGFVACLLAQYKDLPNVQQSRGQLAATFVRMFPGNLSWLAKYLHALRESKVDYELAEQKVDQILTKEDAARVRARRDQLLASMYW
ncbi:hypothetical protein MIR68_009311 [Amoeboaphelidium protococcarum]|nr:hypothetical protein MIR68_009311 [Amoeboaphelidium protococcarum]